MWIISWLLRNEEPSPCLEKQLGSPAACLQLTHREGGQLREARPVLSPSVSFIYLPKGSDWGIKLEHPTEPSGGPVQTQIAGLHAQHHWFAFLTGAQVMLLLLVWGMGGLEGTPHFENCRHTKQSRASHAVRVSKMCAPQQLPQRLLHTLDRFCPLLPAGMRHRA